MQLYDILILSVGLAMDAFAVSVCKGLSLGRLRKKHLVMAGAWFGGFQMLMPVIGYFLASLFVGFIDAFDHWIAFALLALLGANMLREAFGKEDKQNARMDVRTMLLLAIATSIDALAVGVTFAFLEVNVWMAVTIIGAVTFVLSAAGMKLGSLFGTRYRAKAEIAGGLILIMIGVKILLEGLKII